MTLISYDEGNYLPCYEREEPNGPFFKKIKRILSNQREEGEDQLSQNSTLFSSYHLVRYNQEQAVSLMR